MDSSFSIFLNDSNRWQPTDTPEQSKVVNLLMLKCEELGEKPSKVLSGLATNSAGAEFTNTLLSGLSIPTVIASGGYLLKHLSPIIIEFMKSRLQKEITVDYKGIRITVKGGGNFENELDKVIERIESLDSPKIIK